MNSKRETKYHFYVTAWVLGFILIFGCAAKSDIKAADTVPDQSAVEQPVSEPVSESQPDRNLLSAVTLSTSGDKHTVVLTAENAVTYTVFKLSQPDRILIDLQNVSPDPSLSMDSLKSDLVKGISCSEKEYEGEEFLRVEIALSGDVSYNASNIDNALQVELTAKTDSSPAKSVKESVSGENEPSDILLSGISVSANQNDKISIITTADLEKYSAYTLKSPNRIVVDIPGIKSDLKNRIIESNGKIVEKIRVGESSDKVRVVVDLAGDAFPLYQVSQHRKTLTVTFGKTDAELVEKKPVVESSESTVPEEKSTDETDVKQYTGEKISLDFKDADIKNILRLIADISGQNIIISDRAQGKVTLKLEDIPWDEALDIILETNNLGKIVTNNVTRIETREQIKKINEEKLLAKKSEENIADLVVKSYNVSYAKAADLAGFIKNMKVLSDRGSVNSFELTNKLTIQDIEENIPKIEKLIIEQDVPTRQVLIEAKIVQSNPGYVKELGVKWGGTYQTTRNGGPINLSGAADGNVVNLAGASNAAIQFGYIMDNYSLDLQLTALENDDKIKILSSPKILGLDNKEARIKQGVALPYLKLSEEGVTSTEFKDMVLELKVTPKITPADTIAVHIYVTKNQPSAQTGAGGEPGIDVREVETDLLIESAKTIVIGGIYETTNTRIVHKVPFFGDIPFIKKFFRYEKQEDQLQEMLVFLTVTVVDEPSATALEG